MRSSRRAAFTLVEIMIVVAIISLLTAIGIPAFLQYRKDSQDSLYVNEMRLICDAFRSFNIKNNAYPNNGGYGVPPWNSAVTNYIPDIDWSITPIGGYWDWDYYAGNPATSTPGYARLSMRYPERTRAEMLAIDRQIDDGNLMTGKYRMVFNNVEYSFYIDERIMD